MKHWHCLGLWQQSRYYQGHGQDLKMSDPATGFCSSAHSPQLLLYLGHKHPQIPKKCHASFHTITFYRSLPESILLGPKVDPLARLWGLCPLWSASWCHQSLLKEQILGPLLGFSVLIKDHQFSSISWIRIVLSIIPHIQPLINFYPFFPLNISHLFLSVDSQSHY